MGSGEILTKSDPLYESLVTQIETAAVLFDLISITDSIKEAVEVHSLKDIDIFNAGISAISSLRRCFERDQNTALSQRSLGFEGGDSDVLVVTSDEEIDYYSKIIVTPGEHRRGIFYNQFPDKEEIIVASMSKKEAWSIVLERSVGEDFQFHVLVKPASF